MQNFKINHFKKNSQQIYFRKIVDLLYVIKANAPNSSHFGIWMEVQDGKIVQLH